MNPLDFTYFVVRKNAKPGDTGFCCPVASHPAGTIFATFSAWSDKLIQKAPLSRLAAVDTSAGYAIEPLREASGEWLAGHHPKLALAAGVFLPTVPIFADQENRGTIAQARWEGHDLNAANAAGYFPKVTFERASLLTGQTGALRTDPPTATGNHGDSSLPRFVDLPDGRLAFVGQEIFKMGGAGNWTVYARMLESVPQAEFELVTWSDAETPTTPPPTAEDDPLTISGRLQILWEESGREWTQPVGI